MNRKSRNSRKFRKVSLVLGIAVAALSVGVPTALAEGRMAGTQQDVSPLSTQSVALDKKQFEQFATSISRMSAAELQAINNAKGGDLSTYPDAAQRAFVGKTEPGWYKALVIRGEGLSKLYGPGQSGTGLSSVKNTPQWYQALVIRGEGLSKLYGPGQSGTGLSSYKDGGDRAVPQPQSPNVTPTTSDSDIQWPQIGVGILIALVLVLGIGLAVRTNRMRPAH